jgi:hypothetical protein
MNALLLRRVANARSNRTNALRAPKDLYSKGISQSFHPVERSFIDDGSIVTRTDPGGESSDMWMTFSRR